MYLQKFLPPRGVIQHHQTRHAHTQRAENGGEPPVQVVALGIGQARPQAALEKPASHRRDTRRSTNSAAEALLHGFRIPQPQQGGRRYQQQPRGAARPTRKVTGQTIRCQISAAKNGAASTAQGRKSPRLSYRWVDSRNTSRNGVTDASRSRQNTSSQIQIQQGHGPIDRLTQSGKAQRHPQQKRKIGTAEPKTAGLGRTDGGSPIAAALQTGPKAAVLVQCAERQIPHRIVFTSFFSSRQVHGRLPFPPCTYQNKCSLKNVKFL